MSCLHGTHRQGYYRLSCLCGIWAGNANPRRRVCAANRTCWKVSCAGAPARPQVSPGCAVPWSRRNTLVSCHGHPDKPPQRIGGRSQAPLPQHTTRQREMCVFAAGAGSGEGGGGFYNIRLALGSCPESLDIIAWASNAQRARQEGTAASMGSGASWRCQVSNRACRSGWMRQA